MALRLSLAFDHKLTLRSLFRWGLALFLCLSSMPYSYATTTLTPQILILNSYHKGYMWSDQVTSGIEDAIQHSFPDAEIYVEYMDSKRNTSSRYLNKLVNLYREKFANSSYDLVIACDDNAVNLIKNHVLFPTAMPIIFCGTQHIELPSFPNNMTGVTEQFGLLETIELALTLQPNITKIAIINDKTTTGTQLAKQFQQQIKQVDYDLEYIWLEDSPINKLEQQLSTLNEDTIVLLLVYVRDNQGTFYPQDVAASKFSRASSVPIYSFWDFYFNHGVLGGQMNSGFLHGEVTGEVAVKVLQGSSPRMLPIKQGGGSQLLIDYQELQRFQLPVDAVPHEAIVKNINYSEEHNVLMLMSYSHQDQWSQSIISGAQSIFAQSQKNIKISTEFMDTKRYNDKAYINELLLLYKSKYQQMQLDTILVADDNAFSFARRYRHILFPGVPIVFCGVNYLSDAKAMPLDNITGVTESYDILGTIELGLDLFPETKKLYVINDQTTSGKANKLKLDQIKPELPQYLKVIEKTGFSMQQLLQDIQQLDDDTLILLMSFTSDKNNQKFTYEDSIEILSQHSNRPMLGFWDFYAGKGIVGGIITSGQEQGKAAGELTLSILDGTQVKDLAVLAQSPTTKLIDDAQLQRFPHKQLTYSNDITVINHNMSFFERNRQLLIIVGIILTALLALVIAQAMKIKLQSSFNRQLSLQAITDNLTRTKSHRFFESYFPQSLQQSIQTQRPLCLCYMDLDDLKQVNDNFGHQEGDTYIINTVKAIRKHIRTEDELCRIGGDEFVVIFKDCQKDKVMNICKTINEELKLIESQHSPNYPMRISCGISSLNLTQPQTATAMIEEADAQMYLAKSNNKTS